MKSKFLGDSIKERKMSQPSHLHPLDYYFETFNSFIAPIFGCFIKEGIKGDPTLPLRFADELKSEMIFPSVLSKAYIYNIILSKSKKYFSEFYTEKELENLSQKLTISALNF